MSFIIPTCLVRSTTSSLYFDIGFATLSANLDEEFDNRRIDDDANTTSPIISDKPCWWFYNFRIYSQLIVLLFNVAKVIYSASKNDSSSATLSALRSVGVIGIIARHYYLCNYKYGELVHGKLSSHLMPLQFVFMFFYLTVGALSAGIDPYFASDSHSVIIFFLMPIFFRGLSFATATLYSKATTKTKVDGTVVVPTTSASFSYLFFNGYGAVFYFCLAGSNSNSVFFTDRILCGSFFMMSCVSSTRNFLKRGKKRKQVFQELRLSQIAVCNDLEESVDGKVDDDRRNDRESINATVDTVDTAVLDNNVNVLELRKQFTENKIFALITPVACTFMVIMSFELAMSMYLYHRDGIPANWCEPFTFLDIDKGFQIILDYFL